MGIQHTIKVAQQISETKMDHSIKGTGNQIAIWRKKNNAGFYHTSYIKINSNWIKYFNVKKKETKQNP